MITDHNRTLTTYENRKLSETNMVQQRLCT